MLTKFGAFIEKKRRENKITQVDLANHLNLKQGNYSAMIHGKRPFSKAHIKLLSRLLQFSTSDIDYLKGELNDLQNLKETIKTLSPESLKKLLEYANLLKVAETK